MPAGRSCPHWCTGSETCPRRRSRDRLVRVEDPRARETPRAQTGPALLPGLPAGCALQLAGRLVELRRRTDRETWEKFTGVGRGHRCGFHRGGTRSAQPHMSDRDGTIATTTSIATWNANRATRLRNPGRTRTQVKNDLRGDTSGTNFKASHHAAVRRFDPCRLAGCTVTRWRGRRSKKCLPRKPYRE